MAGNGMPVQTNPVGPLQATSSPMVLGLVAFFNAVCMDVIDNLQPIFCMEASFARILFHFFRSISRE
jgi:hypothetical protein